MFAHSHPKMEPIGAPTLSVEDSPVRTSATQASERGSNKEREADSGLKCSESFACYDRSTSSWRTSQRSLFEGWEPFSAPWPRSGMMRNGKCYLRQTAVRRIDASEYLLLPTPNARDYRDCSTNHAYPASRARHSPSLATEWLSAGGNGLLLARVYAWTMGFPVAWHEGL